MVTVVGRKIGPHFVTIKLYTINITVKSWVTVIYSVCKHHETTNVQIGDLYLNQFINLVSLCL